MKKVIKNTLIALTILIGLSMSSMLAKPIYAANEAGSGGGSGLNFNDGNGVGSSRETQKRMSGGASAAKTGFYVTVSVAPSDNAPSHAIGHGAVLKTKSGYDVPAQFRNRCPGDSRIPGASAGTVGVAPWSWPAFRLEGAAGYGGTTKSWLMSQGSNGNSQGVNLAVAFCGVTTQEIQQHINNNEILFVNVEPIMWANAFAGNVKQGHLIGGLTYGVGSTYPQGAGKNFIGTVTHGAFPSSFRYEKAWQAIAPCPDPGGRFSSATMMNKSIGCGIVSAKINDGLQVVICCENEDGSWVTEYLGSGPDYTIVNPYNGYNFVEATFSKKKTDHTEPDCPYATICASGEPDRGVGVGAQHFDATVPEKALFIHYKGSMPIQTPTEAHLKSWETTYLMPKFKAKREDGAAVDNEYTLADHIEEVIGEIESKTKDCPKNGSYVCEHGSIDCTGSAVIDKVTCRGSTNWQVQKYGVRADLGMFPHAKWNLYREEVSGEKWDTFSPALNNVNRWQINKPVDPQFSYYLTRSKLEDVSISPDREGAGALSEYRSGRPNKRC